MATKITFDYSECFSSVWRKFIIKRGAVATELIWIPFMDCVWLTGATSGISGTHKPNLQYSWVDNWL
jgi:hypothetical protein